MSTDRAAVDLATCDERSHDPNGRRCCAPATIEVTIGFSTLALCPEHAPWYHVPKRPLTVERAMLFGVHQRAEAAEERCRELEEELASLRALMEGR